MVVSDYKWSPDSKALAVYGSNRRAGSSVLAVVDPATGRIKVIDKTSAFADFDYSWSPDGRSLAYTKPTRITDHDEVVEADLWISERSGRLSCRVLNTPNRVERRPLWVGARELSLLSAPVAGEQLGDLRTTVLLLSESPSNGRQKATCFP